LAQLRLELIGDPIETPAERSEVITNCDHLKNIKYSRMLPLVFTDHDAELEAIVREIKNLIFDSKPAAKRIGFRRGGEDD
jgi:hypothetical protein